MFLKRDMAKFTWKVSTVSNKTNNTSSRYNTRHCCVFDKWVSCFWKVVNILFQEVFGTGSFFASDDVRFLRWLNLEENGRWFLWNEEIEWEMNDCCQQLAERKEYYKRRRVKWTAVLSWGKTKKSVVAERFQRSIVVLESEYLWQKVDRLNWIERRMIRC